MRRLRCPTLYMRFFTLNGMIYWRCSKSFGQKVRRWEVIELILKTMTKILFCTVRGTDKHPSLVVFICLKIKKAKNFYNWHFHNDLKSICKCPYSYCVWTFGILEILASSNLCCHPMYVHVVSQYWDTSVCW